jgi:hypothetical protein
MLRHVTGVMMMMTQAELEEVGVLAHEEVWQEVMEREKGSSMVETAEAGVIGGTAVGGLVGLLAGAGEGDGKWGKLPVNWGKLPVCTRGRCRFLPVLEKIFGRFL